MFCFPVKILKHIILHIDATFVFESIPAHPIYYGGGNEKKGVGMMKNILMLRKAATIKHNLFTNKNEYADKHRNFIFMN